MFQFQCPNGHLLQGEESQAGQAVNCPTCGILFIIPAPVGAAAPQPEPTPEPEPEPPKEPEILHIPCPNGHELETPEDMLDTEVLCPHCSVQFVLRRKDSIEFKAKKAKEEELKLRKSGEKWLKIAIGFAVVVVLFLLALILNDMLNREPATP